MEEVAYAKINLALHVRDRRPDGYHRIETIFAFAEDGDRLSVGESDTLRLNVVGAFAAALVGENLVLRAAEALRARFDVRDGAALFLDKRLPVASGIGGGSADAAAALRLLNRWWGLGALEAELFSIAASLGADVPACLRSRTAIGRERGDELQPMKEENLSGTPLLLVNPKVPVSTGAVFSGWDGVDRGPLLVAEPMEAALLGRNDLEDPALTVAPAIANVLAALGEHGDPIIVRMSGSGATCFALYRSEEDRDRAAYRIAAENPCWWLLASRLR
ncbi:MAG: 4-(cytidine 5'-diphospho)-2-C-methyl-D-erythritol kinase [Pseudomonadota bacterium]|nr:4-(cytidine 5'-diphospho)-2-C-methyl-D-erythritol kinase [Pseudomonadota bacterium]